MKVDRIITIVDTYNLYRAKSQRDKNALQWELISVGESEKAEKLRKQIKADADSFEKFRKEEV